MNYKDVKSNEPCPECAMCDHWVPEGTSPKNGEGYCAKYPTIIEHGSNGCDHWEGPANIGWDELAYLGRLIARRLYSGESAVIVRRPDAKQRLSFSVEKANDDPA
jgi:hypothetical protein